MQSLKFYRTESFTRSYLVGVAVLLWARRAENREWATW